MDNQAYFVTIEQKISGLKELREQGKSLAADIISETFLKEDFFFLASLDRCMNLIDGFICMLQERNLTCAGALLRLQMDNCLRTYAPFVAKDRDAVFDCIITGEPINKLQSNDGKNMSDAYLKTSLAQYDRNFAKVYDNVCGFIHLSEKAFYQMIEKCEGNKFEFQVGLKLPEKRNPVLIEAADAFIHYVELHFSLLKIIADSKKQFESEYDDQLKQTANET